MDQSIHKRYHTLTDLITKGENYGYDTQMLIEKCEEASSNYLKSVSCDQYCKEDELDYMINILREYIGKDEHK